MKESSLIALGVVLLVIGLLVGNIAGSFIIIFAFGSLTLGFLFSCDYLELENKH